MLLLPGFSLVAALFPRAHDLDLGERLGLGFGLSLAVIALLAFGLSSSPWGLHVTPIVLSLTGWTVAATAAAWWRAARLGPVVGVELPADWREWLGRPAALAPLGGAIMLSAMALAVILNAPPPRTELYVLGPSGLAESYPRSFELGESPIVTVGVVNHEGPASSYRLVVASGPGSMTSESTIHLETGETWEQPIALARPGNGRDQSVQLLLYRDGGSEPYRRLQLRFDGTLPVSTPAARPAQGPAVGAPAPAAGRSGAGSSQ